MTKERYLVKSYGDNQAGTNIGLTKLVQLLGVHKKGMIVVPLVGKVNGSMLTSALGPDLSKRLLKDKILTLEDGRSIGICAQSQLKNHRGVDVFLDLWGTSSSIGDIEQRFDWKAVILVTWVPADSTAWEAQYPVTVIYDDGMR